ncbi:MipA/OmpV family protein [Hansschlegelia plantiphila]|uniref:MltA-interacting MipA family protein n=1 Tax=Hansschlegelia plantiphila TaxID=374655 RepID=A0A9W6MUB2_9HYPH|nr:MipA/OmpV family protein [Hansschlegelia plantiphila]GLK67209.1 MltA-interacting MipA family protein [Hansschlegelia plantiphila]
MRRRLAVLLAAAPLAIFASAASAADISVEAPATAVAVDDGWTATLKGTGVYGPLFEGSNKYGFSGYPGLAIRKKSEPWKIGAPDDGFGIAIVNMPWLQFGPVARVRAERDSSDVKRFYGMKDIDWAVEPGAFLEVYPTENIRLRGELRHGVSGHHGFVGNLAADYIFTVGNLALTAGPRVEIGDHKFMDKYYGVTASEAAQSSRASEYDAGGGVKSVGFTAAATYAWNENWSTTAFGRYDQLVGDAADSPVAKKLGTKSSFTAGVGVGYSFDWSAW